MCGMTYSFSLIAFGTGRTLEHKKHRRRINIRLGCVLRNSHAHLSFNITALPLSLSSFMLLLHIRTHMHMHVCAHFCSYDLTADITKFWQCVCRFFVSYRQHMQKFQSLVAHKQGAVSVPWMRFAFCPCQRFNAHRWIIRSQHTHAHKNLPST